MSKLPFDDCTVHATLTSGDRIVRRDRAGKWYRESEGRLFPVTFNDACALARQPGSTPHFGLPGGRLFDYWVRNR